jgi:hypothetical protein
MDHHLFLEGEAPPDGVVTFLPHMPFVPKPLRLETLYVRPSSPVPASFLPIGQGGAGLEPKMAKNTAPAKGPANLSVGLQDISGGSAALAPVIRKPVHQSASVRLLY